LDRCHVPYTTLHPQEASTWVTDICRAHTWRPVFELRSG
jgi:hypothetical protein